MLHKPDAVVLCGGKGTRLQSVVSAKPKVLAEVNGRPFLDILIASLKKQGLRRIILCTGYMADQVEDYYRKNSQGLDFKFSRESDPLGTGGGLKNAQYFVESDSFLVFNGDSFCPVDLTAFYEFHQSKRARASIVVSRVDDASSFGSIFLDEDAKILGFKEKETVTGEGLWRAVNAGVYCFNEDVFSLMPQTKRFSLEYDLFPVLVGKGFYGFSVEIPFYDIGTPERYDQAQKKLETN